MTLNRSPEFDIAQIVCVVERQFRSAWALTDIVFRAPLTPPNGPRFHAPEISYMILRKKISIFPCVFLFQTQDTLGESIVDPGATISTN